MINVTDKNCNKVEAFCECCGFPANFYESGAPDEPPYFECTDVIDPEDYGKYSSDLFCGKRSFSALNKREQEILIETNKITTGIIELYEKCEDEDEKIKVQKSIFKNTVKNVNSIMSFEEMSNKGLIYLINKKCLHPLGLALTRSPDLNISVGCLKSPDGFFEYNEELIKRNEEKLKTFLNTLNTIKTDNNDTYRSSCVLIIKNNKVLMVSRKEDSKSFCFPGGKVELSETHLEGAIRESKEEVGFKLKEEDLTEIFSTYVDNFFTKMYIVKDYNINELEMEEGLTYKWVAFKKIKYIKSPFKNFNKMLSLNLDNILKQTKQKINKTIKGIKT